MLRWTAAALLWIVGGLLGLVGGLLCVTVILLPLGIPVLFLTRRVFGLAGRLVVPRELRHPISELADRGSDAGKNAAKNAKKTGKKTGKKAKHGVHGLRKRLHLS
ncbi:hypothetical protein KR76_13080 [Pimelobacter simplex]|uniref:Uncharacterized protein n=1 Tax=Nocardioides simplex TaxID=2045 RepID=A0A0A1DLN2_NOCSI|nr:hypothetical protein KR76_13080 [Pimelobacter simplex]